MKEMILSRDDGSRCVAELTDDGTLRVGTQFDDEGRWQWYQDEGVTLRPSEVAGLMTLLKEVKP